MTEDNFTSFSILSVCKGGGYHYCRTSPPHPKRNAKNLYPLHRVLMENKIGRWLRPDEIVHHIDEDKFNNDIENLEVVTRSDHSRHHAKVDSVPCICAACQKRFELKPHLFRLRVKRSKSGRVACSRSCGGKMAGIKRGSDLKLSLPTRKQESSA